MLAVSPYRELLLGRPRDYYAKRWGLVSLWGLNESSGIAYDANGTNHLTAINNPVAGAAKVGTASRAFVSASSQYLSIADNASLSMADIDFGIALWVNFNTSATQAFYGKGSNVVDNKNVEYQAQYIIGTERFRFLVGNSVVNGFVLANNFGQASSSTWYFLLMWHDSVGNTLNIRVNNGLVDSSAYSSGSYDSGDPFYIGRTEFGQYTNGLVDNLLVMKSPPGGIAGVISEISSVLWNNGNGRAIYPWAG